MINKIEKMRRDSMNYIIELNAFYQKLAYEPLSGSAVALWNTLMHFNNRCGWLKQFSVSVGMLELTQGLRVVRFNGQGRNYGRKAL